MAFDFQKLGLDRIAQNIAKSVNEPRGALVTGDIGSGEVVEVQMDGSTGMATVSDRRVGALLLENSAADDLKWSISGTTLTATQSGGGPTTVKFWVF